MPTIEITTNAVSKDRMRELALELTNALTELGVPKEDVTVVFQPVDAVFDGGNIIAGSDYASVDITIPRREEPFKRALAKTLASHLVAAGIQKDSLKLVFRHITMEDVAVGDGTFPFWSASE